MERLISSPDEFHDVVALLNQGGVIVYPTETVYGIGCLAGQHTGITRIADLKGSPPEASYLVLIGDASQVEAYCSKIPGSALELIDLFWPGPLTLILPAREQLHSRLLGPSGGVALRWSSHPWPQALLGKIDDGLISTSANRSGMPAPQTIGELDQTLARDVDMILDNGGLNGGASTILDLCQDPPVLRRPGAIPVTEIENIIGRVA